jgi:hypothetical protein
LKQQKHKKEKGGEREKKLIKKKRIQTQIPGGEIQGAAPRQTFQFQKKKARRRRTGARSLSRSMSLKP